MTYQDVWVKGKTIKKGQRECESRYNIIRTVLKDFKGPHSLLDFGADLGYFSFRTAYDNPCWNITLVDPGIKTGELIKQNDFHPFKFINAHMTLSEVFDHSVSNYYDVVYALNVLHHFDDPVTAFRVLRNMGTVSIFEIGYPKEVPYANEHLFPLIYETVNAENPVLINGHVEHDRPLYYFNQNEITMKATVHNGCGSNSNEVWPEFDRAFQSTYDCNYYHGSLNLTLEKKVTLLNETSVRGIRIYPTRINGVPVQTMRGPEIKYPTDEIEVFSPYYLRGLLNLTDGQTVTVSFPKTSVLEAVDYL